MNEYLIQGGTLVSLADKIRVLSGSEDTMTPAEMGVGLDEANNEVGIQSDLIDQLMEALDGKAAGGAPSGTIEITENGTYDVVEFAEAEVNVVPVLQNKTVTPTTSQQTVTADDGYDGLDVVTVEGDVNLAPENIPVGISIFGVAGSLAPGAQFITGTTYAQNSTLTIAIEAMPKMFVAYYPGQIDYSTYTRVLAFTDSLKVLGDSSSRYAITSRNLGDPLAVTFSNNTLAIKSNASGIGIQTGNFQWWAVL